MYNPSSPPRNISFRVDTIFPHGRVGRIKPNEHGIYCGLPMMVLGEVTQQKTYYDPASVMDQIINPETRFHKVLKSGKLFGEWGHPAFPSSMSQEDMLTRLVTVDEKSASHLFVSLHTDSPSADGTVVIRADVKPSGPYGAVFKESLEDPIVNTAFSVRAYVDTKVKPNGLKHRVVRQLTSFDCVGASGYATTDKAHAIGLESFSGDEYHEFDIAVMRDGNLMIDQIALETFSDSDYNEIFGCRRVSKVIQSRTFVKTDTDLASRFPGLYGKTVFNDFFKE